jgi:hypothetical protein
MAKQNRAWSDHTSTNFYDYDLPKNFIGSGDGFPSKKEINGSYAYPDGNVPLPGEAGAGNGLRGEALGGNPWDAHNTIQQAKNRIKPITAADIKEVVNQLTNTDIQNANLNLKPNPIYGYGNLPLEYDYSGYETPLDAPEGQDVLYGYFEDIDKANTLDAAPFLMSPDEKGSFARAFTILRNYNDYLRDQNLEQQAAETRQRNLYGDTLVDLLQNTPEGQSILGEARVQKPKPMARERHISGPAQW